MADDEHQQQAQQQPNTEQPEEVQLPPQGPTPEGPGGLGKNGEPPFLQQQAPSYETIPGIIPNCAYATNPDYDNFQEAGQAHESLRCQGKKNGKKLRPSGAPPRIPGSGLQQI